MSELRFRPVTPREEDTFHRLSSLNLSDLYAQFGQQLGTLAPGATAESQAKGWFASQKSALYSLICVQGQYCSFISRNRNARAVEILAALSDLLASAVSGVPVYTLAALLLRLGLDEFCECDSAKAS
jgi:hypothetical protein